MTFTTLTFVIFLLLIFIAYWSVLRRRMQSAPVNGQIFAEVVLFAGFGALKARAALVDAYLSTTPAMRTNLLLLFSLAVLVSLLPTRARRAVLFSMASFLSLLLFTDAVHYRALHEFLSLAELGHAAQLGGFFSSIFPYVRWTDVLFVADFPIWMWLLWKPRHTVYRPRLRLATWLSTVLLAAGAYVWGIFEFITSPQMNQPMENNRRYVVREVGLLSFHLFDAISLGQTMPEAKAIVERDVRRVHEWFASPKVAGVELLPFGVARGHNLIFLQVESLEAFVVGLRVNGQEVTPQLNRLAGRSFYFNRFFPQTGIGQTSDGEFCALNSLLPARTGVAVWRDAKNSFRSLPLLLRENGYHTISMTACRSNIWNMGWMHYTYGFQERCYYERFGDGKEDFFRIDDDRFLTRARELLRNQPRPFFAHLMTLTSHSPFTQLAPEKRTFALGEWKGSILGDYLQSVHFVDAAIGKFLEALKADGRDRDTVVVIYGDHEAVPDDEWRRTHELQTDSIGWRLDEKLRRRVPLFIIVPGTNSPGTRERAGGQIDLAPTALHLLGFSRQDTFFLGENLFQDNEAIVPFRNGSFAATHQFFSNREVSRQPVACETLASETTPEPGQCDRLMEQARERIEISDLILEQNMIPALRRAAKQRSLPPSP